MVRAARRQGGHRFGEPGPDCLAWSLSTGVEPEVMSAELISESSTFIGGPKSGRGHAPATRYLPRHTKYAVLAGYLASLAPKRACWRGLRRVLSRCPAPRGRGQLAVEFARASSGSLDWVVWHATHQRAACGFRSTPEHATRSMQCVLQVLYHLKIVLRKPATSSKVLPTSSTSAG